MWTKGIDPTNKIQLFEAVSELTSLSSDKQKSDQKMQFGVSNQVNKYLCLCRTRTHTIVMANMTAQSSDISKAQGM